jgi:hypothetical protein
MRGIIPCTGVALASQIMGFSRSTGRVLLAPDRHLNRTAYGGRFDPMRYISFHARNPSPPSWHSTAYGGLP